MTSEFVHLHNHSDYSLLDGAQRVDQLINTIGDLNMDSVALTEHGNMFSVLPYYKEAKKAWIKPIIGCEMYISVGSRFDKKVLTTGGWGNNHLILLAKNFMRSFKYGFWWVYWKNRGSIWRVGTEKWD